MYAELAGAERVGLADEAGRFGPSDLGVVVAGDLETGERPLGGEEAAEEGLVEPATPPPSLVHVAQLYLDHCYEPPAQVDEEAVGLGEADGAAPLAKGDPLGRKVKGLSCGAKLCEEAPVDLPLVSEAGSASPGGRAWTVARPPGAFPPKLCPCHIPDLAKAARRRKG
jgi:hypothetical protein